MQFLRFLLELWASYASFLILQSLTFEGKKTQKLLAVIIVLRKQKRAFPGFVY